MRAFTLILLAAVLLVQFTDALPRPKRSLRLRREALRWPRSTSSENEVMTEKDKVVMFGAVELIGFGKGSVRSHKTFFDQIVKNAKSSDLDLDKELQELKDFSKEAGELTEEDELSDEYIKKVFDLFEKSNGILQKYDLDEIKNPTDKQRTIARLMEDNGLVFLYLNLLGRIGAMRQKFTTRFQAYVDSFTATERKKERKFIDWFNKFKNERDMEKVIENMFDFFDVIE